ncbi:ParB/RepB/Spo0J family partition protein [Streptomyces sp. NPDC004728]|uniref:ParB/RepB/Spo0J family partition protein n=1 Tax=Streptomyces sp. NPDC004728 TaxID=3154289 RepID=UPI00339F7679
MAAKKKAWNDLLGKPGTGAGADAAAAENGSKEPPATVLMHTIVGNPENPRDEDDYSDTDPEFAELKDSMKEIGQLQPLAVISRPAYERTKPGHSKALGDAQWVVVTGNRRLAAARQLGWTRIDVKVQDRLGDGDGSMIDEAVIIENIHRKNIAPIREAEFLQRMVERLGSQDKAAARIGKSQMYVSHRLALLQLAPDVQRDVDTGAVKLKDVRTITRKPYEEQRAAVAELKKKAAAPKESRKAAAAEPVQNPVLKSAAAPVAAPVAHVVQNPVLNEPKPLVDEQALKLSPEAADVPEQRADPLARPPVKMPWHDGAAAMEIIFRKLDEEQRRVAIGRYLEKVGGPEAAAADLKAAASPEYLQALFEHLSSAR